MNHDPRACYVSVKDIFDNPDAYLQMEVIVKDFAVAQSCMEPYQDLFWMLSEEWLNASLDQSEAVMDRSRAIQLCLKLLSADLVDVAAHRVGLQPIERAGRASSTGDQAAVPAAETT